ncbi:hypothetical protein C7M84_019049 [Penaeus vannamei]|uniref:Uncharacterized protein n=1 Tax=Penaeus vannamei TaxID=6689 RepID=A0A423SFX8_PENVA|nr:hypothetical protein C7M84_019049 [Penaeus vannamei]
MAVASCGVGEVPGGDSCRTPLAPGPLKDAWRTPTPIHPPLPWALFLAFKGRLETPPPTPPSLPWALFWPLKDAWRTPLPFPPLGSPLTGGPPTWALFLAFKEPGGSPPPPFPFPSLGFLAFKGRLEDPLPPTPFPPLGSPPSPPSRLLFLALKNARRLDDPPPLPFPPLGSVLAFKGRLEDHPPHPPHPPRPPSLPSPWALFWPLKDAWRTSPIPQLPFPPLTPGGPPTSLLGLPPPLPHSSLLPWALLSGSKGRLEDRPPLPHPLPSFVFWPFCGNSLSGMRVVGLFWEDSLLGLRSLGSLGDFTLWGHSLGFFGLLKDFDPLETLPFESRLWVPPLPLPSAFHPLVSSLWAPDAKRIRMTLRKSAFVVFVDVRGPE